MTEKKPIIVTKELARFFADQVSGEWAGHMGMIPHNPVLYGLVGAHAALKNDERLAEFLRAIADQLDHPAF